MPEVQVTNLRKVFDNGEHNAFTDLCKFQNRIYLAFRSCPDGHPIHATSRIIVLSSEDGDEWHEVFDFNVSLRDTRDPHFLVFNERLYVYTGCWLLPSRGEHPDLNDHLGFGAWTDDGVSWHGPLPLEGTHGHYVWRAAAYGDRAYLCGRRRHHFIPRAGEEENRELIEAALLESEDGLVWKFRSLFTEKFGDETSFLFEGDG